MSFPSMVTTLLWGEALPLLGLNFLVCEMRGGITYIKPLCISLIWQRGFSSRIWRGAPWGGGGGSLLSMARMWPGQGSGDVVRKRLWALVPSQRVCILAQLPTKENKSRATA